MIVIVRNKRAVRLDVTRTNISASFKDYGNGSRPKIRDDRKLEQPLPDFKTGNMDLYMCAHMNQRARLLLPRLS